MMMNSCPVPDFDFDVITLGHGSGGALTNQLLESGIFKILHNDYLKTRHDGAVIDISEKMAFTTDSYVVSPIFFPGGNIGDLAVNGTVNDLAMCGAVSGYLSLSLIIEEGMSVSDLWKVLQSIRRSCDLAGVRVVTGDTKVVEKGKADKLFINTTGIGQIHPKAEIHPDRVSAGDAIILSGNIAVHGVTIMSLREGLTFGTSLTSDTKPLNHMVSVLLDQFGSEIHLLRDATRGGVATILNEVAGHVNAGVDIFERDIPVPYEVEGACEMLGLDPLYVANEGVFCAFVNPNVAVRFLQSMKSLPGGEHARIIGHVVDDHRKNVVLTNEIGGRRIVSMLPGEQLPRIC